jgi:hypothetical protein
LSIFSGAQVVSHHLPGRHLPQGEEGLKEVLTFFPASFRESAEVWKEVLSGLKGEGLEGTPALHRGWAHRTSPCG